LAISIQVKFDVVVVFYENHALVDVCSAHGPVEIVQDGHSGSRVPRGDSRALADLRR
jgi:hypothetical protein